MLEEENIPDHVKSLPDDDEAIVESPVIQNYKKAVSALCNEGEDSHTLENYKQATLELLLGKEAVSKFSS